MKQTRWKPFEVVMVIATIGVIAFALLSVFGSCAPAEHRKIEPTKFTFGDRDYGVINDVEIQRRIDAVDAKKVADAKAEAYTEVEISKVGEVDELSEITIRELDKASEADGQLRENYVADGGAVNGSVEEYLSTEAAGTPNVIQNQAARKQHLTNQLDAADRHYNTIKDNMLTPTQQYWWEVFQRQCAQPHQLAAINTILHREGHQNVDSSGRITGALLEGWGIGGVGGKYHHCWEVNGRYLGAACIDYTQFTISSWANIVAKAQTNPECAWRMYAAQMSEYLWKHHGTDNYASINTWSW